MLIDCDTCAVRGPACGDCVVTVLLGAPPVLGTASPPDEVDLVDLDTAEQAAIAVLAGSGLVPPLRLVPVDEPADDGRHPAGRRCGPARGRAAEAG